MQRFWETVIEPVLEAVQPKTIVEIGSDQGGNTENLLEFCRKTGSTLHVIDPDPGYDVSEWQREHGERLVFHKDLSLNALPTVEDFDAVLIDGDHNWYTVFNELKTIERLCDERSRRFPLVMLHDIGWPYGRRDLYYDPDSIPEQHRKPYERKGMLPGVASLLEKDGLNQHLRNALLEGEPRSGVLTAVEDFMEETDHQLELTRLPGIHGLGILIPSQLKESNAKLADFLEQLRFSSFVSRYIEGVERARLEIQILQHEERVNNR
ncbi:MAG TPA: class I SAM-dependent methyltransferase, partial [Rubrobacter sp.]|nr:class I SAM-dependent methyltransferase [Rubrobacter sp.]